MAKILDCAASGLGTFHATIEREEHCVKEVEKCHKLQPITIR